MSADKAGEAIAYWYQHPAEYDPEEFGREPLTEADKEAGWTETPLYTRPDDYAAARAEASINGVWEQARQNHEHYSATGSKEEDIRFFALGLTGEAGEVANFVKKRWRDGDGHDEDLRKECADVLAYTMMLAQSLGMTPADLIEMVAHKQQVFIAKMEPRNG